MNKNSEKDIASIVETTLFDIGPDGVQAAISTVEDSSGIFDDARMQYRPVPGRAKGAIRAVGRGRQTALPPCRCA